VVMSQKDDGSEDQKAKTGRGDRVRIPLIKVDHVVVEGNVTLTTPVLHALLDNNIEISFLSYYGNFKGALSTGFSKNSLLRVAQHRAHNDPEQRLELSKRLVKGKLSNMRTLLMRYNRKDEEDEFGKQVRVIEQASAAYFSCFGRLLKQDMGFRGRFRRPPTDPVNALLSYGYTILISKLASVIHSVGMDPHVGYLHTSQYGRPALALDLVEEFRSIIVDSVVLTVINNRMLQQGDFTEEMGSIRLQDPGRKRFLGKFEERLNTEVTHPVFGYRVTYKRCLELQARLLAKTLTGEIKEYTPFTVR
jgi:CRISPR-associated protein Cas1